MLDSKASESDITLPELTNEGNATKLLEGFQLIDSEGNVVEGSMPVLSSTDFDSSISVSSNGLINATFHAMDSGYVNGNESEDGGLALSETKQLTVQAATTYTPTTSDQTIASGKYITGTQTIKGDANLIAENIKSGTSIFGIVGSYEGDDSNGPGIIETCTVTFRNACSNGLIQYVGVDDSSSPILKNTAINNSLSSIECVTNTLIVAYNAVLDGDELLLVNGLCGDNVTCDVYINYLESGLGYGIYIFNVTGDGWIDVTSPEK